MILWVRLLARSHRIILVRAELDLIVASDCAQLCKRKANPMATRRYDDGGKVKEPMNGLAILQPFSGRFPLWSKK